MTIRKYLFLYTLLSFSLCTNVWAQEEEDPFSVEDDTPAIGAYDLAACIQHAFEHTEKLKKTQLDIRTAEAEISETIATGLPQINLEANFTHNLMIQKSFIPSVFFDPNAEPGSFTAVEFQPRYNGNAALTLNQLIFDASYFLGLKASRKYKSVSEKQYELDKIDIAEQVANAYYGVLVSREQIALLKQNETRLDTLLKETKALFENGFVEQIDVMRTEVALNNIRTELRKAEQTQVMSQQLLKYQMGMPLRDSIAVIGDLSQIDLSAEDLLAQSADPKNRLEYDLLRTQSELNELNLRYNKSVYYPRLMGFASYGSNTGVNQFGDIVKFRERWFDYAFWGLSLSMPIFDGTKRKHTLQKQRIAMQRVEQDMREFERTANLQATQSRLQLAESLADLESQKRNMELAGEVSRVAQIKYQNGVGSNLEIIDAETSYKEAETNYYAALYQALVNKVSLAKSLGILLEEVQKN